MKKIITLLFCTLLLFFFCCSNVKADEFSTKNNLVKIISYEDVLKAYYNRYENERVDNEIVDFNTFCEGFYEDKKSIKTYTENLIDGTKTQDRSINLESTDADYILSSSNFYTYTPESDFKREPFYDNLCDYSSILSGDIVYETQTILDIFGIGHNAIVVNKAKEGYYGNFIQTVEAVGGGVQCGFLDDQRMVEFKIIILRVNGRTSSVVSNVLFFLTQQLGKPYRIPDDVIHTNINSLNWYCSELVYAAYLYAGINIASKTVNGNVVYPQNTCMPEDIYMGDNTINLEIEAAIKLSIDSKQQTTWYIKIENPTNKYITYMYNSRMCNKNDAKNWTNLYDVSNVSLMPSQYSIVAISERLFCGYITISILENVGSYNKRYVFYCHNLNSNNYTMTIETNIVPGS